MQLTDIETVLNSFSTYSTAEIIKVTPRDGQKEDLDITEPYTGKELSTYHQISSIAKKFWIHMDAPEIVFTGLEGSEKTRLIEGLIGKSILPREPPKRPIYYQLKYTEEETGKIFVMAEENFGSSVCTGETLAAEIEQRNFQTDLPLVIVIESSHTLPVTFIDTPEIGEDWNEQAAKIVVKTCQEVTPGGAQRLIVAVDTCEKEEVRSKIVDGLRGRAPVSVRVLTSVSPCVNDIDESQILKIFRERNSLLMFGVDLCGKEASEEEDADETTVRDIKETLKKKSETLKELVSNTGCKSKSENLNLGFVSFFSFIERFVLKTHQKSLPRIKTLASSTMKMVQLFIETLKRRIAFFKEDSLRQQSRDFLKNFSKLFNSLMNGEEQDRIKGETVAEEKGEVDETDEQERLYGKKQFQRLIKEFLSVCDSIKMEKVSQDELYNVCGVTPLTMPDASALLSRGGEVARAALRRQLRDATTELCERGKHIERMVCQQSLELLVPAAAAQNDVKPTHKQFKSQSSSVCFGAQSLTPTLGQSLVSQSKSEKSDVVKALLKQQEEGDKSIQHYPYFATWVREVFDGFVDEIAALFERAVIDELNCVVVDEESNVKKLKKTAVLTIGEIAKSVFDSNKEAIATNLSNKFYELFLVAYEGRVKELKHTEMSAEQLEELFEAAANKAGLEEKLDRVTKLQATLKENESKLAKTIDSFTA